MCIRDSIRAFLDGSEHKHWAKNLPFLQLALNTSKQESTGFTPAALLFNRELNLPFDVSVGLSDSEIRLLTKSVPKSQRELVYDRSEQYSKILSLVRSNLQVAQERQRQNYDKRHRDDHFDVGDTVVVKDTTLSNKQQGISAGLCALYRPYVGKIKTVMSNLNYVVEFEDGSVKGPLHIQLLRRYHERDSNDGNNIDTNIQHSD